jgi:C_GCAxxG_C_C family probable redox protein
MDTGELASNTFRGGFNCSQAVLSSFAGQFQLDPATALKLGAAFGGGMGRTAGVCGAVSGALMALGLKFGCTTPTDAQAKARTYAKAEQLLKAFAARHGSIQCRDILGCDISTPDGLKQAQDNKLFQTLCPDFVRTAAQICEQLLKD